MTNMVNESGTLIPGLYQLTAHGDSGVSEAAFGNSLLFFDLALIDLGTGGTQTPPTPVPEPTSLLLFGAGAVGLLAKARRHRKQQMQ
jgi:hypothetical protein